MKVIITGMHRSGTSMVAGLLQLCGLYLGKNLLGRHPSNDRGHYEDREFLAINIELLQHFGGNWSNPPLEVPGIPNKYLLRRMRAFVSSWPVFKMVGWKDPRACLTLHLWKAVLGQEQLKVILVTRPFKEIAASLKARNRFTIEKGLYLSFIYLKRAGENLIGTPYHVTSYEGYFKHWMKELKGMTDFLGLQIPKDHTKIKEFIDPNLWHQRSSG